MPVNNTGKRRNPQGRVAKFDSLIVGAELVPARPTPARDWRTDKQPGTIAPTAVGAAREPPLHAPSTRDVRSKSEWPGGGGSRAAPTVLNHLKGPLVPPGRVGVRVCYSKARMTKVASSLKRSSQKRFTDLITEAFIPSASSARWLVRRSINLSSPNWSPAAFSASVTPSV